MTSRKTMTRLASIGVPRCEEFAIAVKRARAGWSTAMIPPTAAARCSEMGMSATLLPAMPPTCVSGDTGFIEWKPGTNVEVDHLARRAELPRGQQRASKVLRPCTHGARAAVLSASHEQRLNKEVTMRTVYAHRIVGVSGGFTGDGAGHHRRRRRRFAARAEARQERGEARQDSAEARRRAAMGDYRGAAREQHEAQQARRDANHQERRAEHDSNGSNHSTGS